MVAAPGPDPGNGRYTVALQGSGEQIKVKPAHLQLASVAMNSSAPVGDSRSAAEALARKAVAHGRAHQVQQMTEAAEQACEICPTYYGGYCMRARVRAQRGQLEEALADFELANDLAAADGQIEESEALFGLQGFLHNFRQRHHMS